MRRRSGHNVRRVCFYRDWGGFGVPFPLNFAASWCPQHHLQLNGKQGARAPSDAPTCAAPATVSERRVYPPSREEDGCRAVCPYATVPLEWEGGQAASPARIPARTVDLSEPVHDPAAPPDLGPV